MKALTRDEIQHLAPEEQGVIAKVEVSHLKKREKLLEYARGYRGKGIIATVLPALFVLAPTAVMTFKVPLNYFIGSVIVVVAVLVHYQVIRINRRIDALVELLDVEKQVSRLDQPENDRNS